MSELATARERLAQVRRILDEGLERSPEEEARVLEQRAQRLAQRPPDPVDHTGAREVLVVSLGGERRSLDVEHVLGVEPAAPPTPVPGTPPFVVGLMARRGRVLAVMDLCPLLGLTSTDGATEVVAVELDGVAFGIVADGVEGPLRQVAGVPLAPPLDLRGLVAERRLEIDHEGER